MNNAHPWNDVFTIEKDRILLTENELHIPGIRLFAHHLRSNATNALSWHYHEGAFEISLPAQGIFAFSTETKTYSFSGGDIFISQPNEIHGTGETPVTLGELYWFQLDIRDENHFLFLNKETAHRVIEDLKAIPHHVVQADLKITLPIIRKAFKLAQNPENTYLVASLLQLFLHVLLLRSKAETSRVSSDIQKILDYIQENITSDLSLNTLSDLIGLSCSQFKQKFKKQLGISPRHYINQQKIEFAKKLLQNGTSVTETAMLLNFTTSSYFSTVFKKYTLVAPSEYLEENKGAGK